MSSLVLQLLGTPRCQVDGVAVDFRRRKVLALLAYLAVTQERHSRDQLADLLYERSGRDRALANLRHVLTLLREAVGEGCVCATRHQVSLRRTPEVAVDVVDFQRLIGLARQADRQGETDVTSSALERAVGLYRGEFLEGFYLGDSVAFEDWQSLVQENLRSSQSQALGRLMEAAVMENDHGRALEYARSRFHLDPFDQSHHGTLLELVLHTGGRAEALRQFEQIRELLSRELGLEPDEAALRVRDRILAAGSPAPALTARAGRLPALRVDAVAADTTGALLWCRPEGAPEEGEWSNLETLVQDAGARWVERVGTALRAFFTDTPSALSAAAALLRCRTGGTPAPRCAVVKAEVENQAAPSTRQIERAAALLQTARSGDILVDDVDAQRISADTIPPEASVLDLGRVRLTDLRPGRPVCLVTLDAEPTPPAVLDDCPNNLPVQTTTFIGRSREVATLIGMISSADTRLLTLLGPAGTGKSRLALQVAAAAYDAYPGGIRFIDLSSARSSDDVVAAVDAGVRLREHELDGRSRRDALADHIGKRRVLLILDNFEQVREAAGEVVALLGRCPNLAVVATSRRALHAQPERTFVVPPLDARDSGSDRAGMSDAVELFVDRARAARPSFSLEDEDLAAVAEICRRLDGLPLAIELAAGRTAAMSARALLRVIENRLDFVKSECLDLPERQQSLMSEIAWSYDLLAPREQRVFRRAAVFAGSWTARAAANICCRGEEAVDIDSILFSLADQSVVVPVLDESAARFRMLETFRAFGAERRRAAGEEEEVQKQFVSYYLQFVEEAEPAHYGPQQLAAFAEVDREYPNIRAVLSILARTGAWEEGLQLSGALGWYWFRRGHFREGREWLEHFRARIGDDRAYAIRAKAAHALGWLRLCMGTVWGNPTGKELFEESYELWKRLEDFGGMARSLSWLTWPTGAVETLEDRVRADESVALARRSGDPWSLAWCLKVAFGHLRRSEKSLAERRAALEEAITNARRTGDGFLIAQTLNGMGHVYGWMDEVESAEPWYVDALALAREVGDPWSELDNLFYIGYGHFVRSDKSRARETFAEGMRLAAEYGVRGYLGWFTGGLYLIAADDRAGLRALRLGAYSESILNPGAGFSDELAVQLGLDPGVAAAEWRRAQELTVDEAVALALTEV